MNTDSRSRTLTAKCQYISLDTYGFVIESDNTLFATEALMGMPIMLILPSMKKIYRKIRSLQPADQPLFYQNIRVQMNGFSSVCDFIFSKVERSEGESIVWFIYDNSTHFSLNR
ncbi:MAG: hypothetical protein LC117_01865 [Bacteroidia bacterium]|nr:hypothetical protein [Bacteroidia bacterium]MCZ2276662.1 hypothetical protein [Bacteroidia bacterium]